MTGLTFWMVVIAVIVITIVILHYVFPKGTRGRFFLTWSWRVALALVAAGFLHYTLPQHDIVRIVGTQIERQDLSDWTRIFWSRPDDQSEGLVNRDVQFIQAIYPDGGQMVYRNEDTSWSWPPYFKFDTSSLLTEAQDAVSTKENPRWFVVTHYGWRNQYLSIFPNAVGIRPATGPDETVIPWFNIVFFIVLALILFMIRRMWLQFRERSIDPVLDDAGEVWDGVEERAGMAADEVRGVWGRLRAWLLTWRGRPRS